LEHYLGKFANEMVKWCFGPILLFFTTFYLQNYIIFIFYPCPKVLTTWQSVDFCRLKGLEMRRWNKGPPFLICFCIFFLCTDPFRVFQEKLRAES
jgi:hypothetical protein